MLHSIYNKEPQTNLVIIQAPILGPYTILYDTIRYHTILYDTIRYYTIRYYTTVQLGPQDHDKDGLLDVWTRWDYVSGLTVEGNYRWGV